MGILARLAAPVVGLPVAPPPAVIARFPELGAARYRRGGLPPRVGGWILRRPTVAAITLWRTVFVAPDAPLAAPLLLHELRHVQHFEASLLFPLRYMWESLRHGYDDNPYETDARAWTEARLRAAPPSI